MRIRWVIEVFGTVLVHLRAAKLRDERIARSRLGVAEIEVVQALPMPGLERGLREQERQHRGRRELASELLVGGQKGARGLVAAERGKRVFDNHRNLASARLSAARNGG